MSSAGFCWAPLSRGSRRRSSPTPRPDPRRLPPRAPGGDNAGMHRRRADADASRAGRDGSGRRQNTGVALGASLLGAIVTFLYFRYVDVGPGAPRPGVGELVFSGIAFAAL